MADTAIITSNVTAGNSISSDLTANVEITTSVVQSSTVTTNVVAGGVGGVVSVNGLTDVVTLDTDDIPEGTNKYVTSAEKTKLSNLSGTNTGDQDLSGYVPTTRTVNTKALSSNVTLTQDDVGDGSTYKQYSSTEKTKLSGIASGATANSSDATLLDRANHTGTQAESTITNLVSDLAAKQPLDSDLTTIAGLTATTDNFIQAKSSAWASRTPAQVTADLPAFVGDSGSGGTKGLVPAPSTGDSTKFLKGDGTWTTVSGGGDALTTNPLSQFASTTSLQLKGVISDETGSGALVFGTSPNITTPTGIVKGDVGLGNVDNTSDATKDAATTTLTNKTLSLPKITGAGAGTATLQFANTGTSTTATIPSEGVSSISLVTAGSTQTLTNKTLDSTSPTAFQFPGFVMPYAGRTSPNTSHWLLCDGSAVSRTTYSGLFAAIVPSVGTFTVTIATPAVVTLNSHGFVTGDQVYLTTTGALPTGLSANTLYYVIKVDTNTFNLATSRANALASTAIATSGSQSGTHTLRACPYGIGDGSTTFNIPDLRGRVAAGADAMGGTAASRLTLARSQGTYGQLGASGGAESHTLVTAELASHTHLVGDTAANRQLAVNSVASVDGIFNFGGANVRASSSTGSDTAHNNVQPTLTVNYLIKT